MKVSELKKKVDAMPQDQEIAVEWVTEEDVKSVAREQNIPITPEQVSAVLASLEESQSNWDDVVAEHLYEVTGTLP